VVAEEMQLDLDRVGGAEALQERLEGPRAGQLVDETEQVRRTFLGPEAQRVDQLGSPGRNGGSSRREALPAEVEGVVVVVEDGRQAHQHLGGLRHVDLDADAPGAGEVEHLRFLLFDGHLTARSVI
jgi:hypothetical protein